jgi:putative PIN family toxin of toxin-antitoxin system
MVSAVLVGGSPPAQVLDGWREHRFWLVTSQLLIGEVEEVLARPKFHARVTRQQRVAFVALLRQRSHVCPDPAPAPGLTPDPGDDYLGALVIATSATHLVTGDAGLLGWNTNAATVTTPRQFLEELRLNEPPR